VSEEGQLRWTDPEEAVRLAREHGFTDAQIVKIVSGSLPHQEVLKVAREYAPLLGISVSEFMKWRRNA
jgi:hypothetical protein